MTKPYDVGLICGRFQTFHKGHEKLVNTGLLLCDRLLILVGSAQECGTERNPLNVTTRIKMIKEVYGDNPNIMIYGLADMTNENDICHKWGRYLLSNADRYIYKNPDIMIYGNDDSRSDWFDKKDLKNTTELIINRAELPISATLLRNLMIADKRKEWMELVNPKLHKMYDELRRELLGVPYYNSKLVDTMAATKEIMDGVKIRKEQRISWYRDSDGKIITDEEYKNDCMECECFCQEETVNIPCNGERTDCPYFKEVDTSDYDKEIRDKAIEELSCKLMTYFADCQLKEEGAIVRDVLVGVIERIDEITEQMKEVGE